MVDRAWLAATVIGLTAVTILAALPGDAATAGSIALQVTVLAIVGHGVARHQSAGPGWWLLAASCAVGAAASVAVPLLPPDLTDWTWVVTFALRQLLLLSGLAAILGFTRGLQANHHLLDAGIIAVGITVCAWALVIQPRFGSGEPHGRLAHVGLTFAVLDFLLLWLLARIITSAAYRTPTMLLLAAGIVPVLVANLLANTELGRHGLREFQPGHSVHLAWQVCGVLIAAAVLRWRNRRIEVPEEVAYERIPRWRFGLLVSIALLTPVIPLAKLLSSASVVPRQVLIPFTGLSLLVSILIMLLMIRLANVARLEVRRADAMDQQSAMMATQAEALQRTLDSQRALQGELAWRATHDPLTRLANRALLAERLLSVLHSRPTPSSGALLLIDLDDFKEVNDSLGHPVGDQVLIEVGRRLTSAASSSENVARLGGDEFAMVVEGSDPPASRQAARNLAETLTETYVLGERKHQLTASTGLVLLKPPHHDATGALRDADLAMYAAKRAGGNQFVEFSDDLRVAHERYVELVAGVRTALAENGLRLAYQPIVDIATGRTVAVEALLRWQAASGRPFSPGEFIAVAEDIGLVCDVGADVLDTATSNLAGWSAAHPVSVSVNVSGRQLMSPSFAQEVLVALDRHAVSPDALILEITETVLIHAGGATGVGAMRNLDALRESHVRIAVDDFGTGYSSLAYLQQLPIDILKVDRMFTAALEDPDERNVKFVGAILNLGASLGLPVVAEGVESSRQATLLAEMGCPLAQGYYYARPCAVHKVVEYFSA